MAEAICDDATAKRNSQNTLIIYTSNNQPDRAASAKYLYFFLNIGLQYL